MSRYGANRLRAFTVRVDATTYLSAKAFAVMTDVTLAELVTQALVDYLAQHGVDEQLDNLVEETRNKFRETADVPD